MKIRIYPDPILRIKCKPVEEFTPQIRQYLKEMAQAMYLYGGAGLAAPQVGLDVRLIVADAGGGLISLVNPVVIKKEGKSKLEEGCLSIPDIHVEVKRAAKVVVEGLDEEGKKIKMQAEGLIAHVLQHEIDHLDGKLIIDYAGLVKKLSLKPKLRALKEEYSHSRKDS